MHVMYKCCKERFCFGPFFYSIEMQLIIHISYVVELHFCGISLKGTNFVFILLMIWFLLSQFLFVKLNFKLFFHFTKSKDCQGKQRNNNSLGWILDPLQGPGIVWPELLGEYTDQTISVTLMLVYFKGKSKIFNQGNTRLDPVCT